jgi:hypothetical protein
MPPAAGVKAAAGHPKGPGLDTGENGNTITSRDAGSPTHHDKQDQK